MTVIASYSSFGKLQWKTHARPKPKARNRYKAVLWTISTTGYRDEVEVSLKRGDAITIKELLPACLGEMTDLIGDRKDINSFGFEIHLWG